MRLEAAFVEKHLSEDLRNISDPKELKKIKTQIRTQIEPWTLKKGSDEWVAAMLAEWPKMWDKLHRILFGQERAGGKGVLTLAEATEMAALESEWARKWWPLETTEALATDRVHWHGLGNALKIMTAFGLLGREESLVTYRGLGRDFAAAVLELDSTALRVAVYNMSRADKEAAVVPWLLDVGDGYRLRGIWLGLYPEGGIPRMGPSNRVGEDSGATIEGIPPGVYRAYARLDPDNLGRSAPIEVTDAPGQEIDAVFPDLRYGFVVVRTESLDSAQSLVIRNRGS